MSAKRFTIAALAAFVLILSVAFTRAIPSVKAMWAVDDTSGTVSTSTPGAEMELVGTLESMNGSTWVIDGQEVTVTGQTELNDILAVGDFVKVHVSEDANGLLVAHEVESAVPGQADDMDDNMNDNQNGDMDDDHQDDFNDDHGNDNSSTDDQSSGSSNDNDDHSSDDDHGDHDDDSHDDSGSSHDSDDEDEDDDHSGSDD